jgi:hypothetical protein
MLSYGTSPASYASERFDFGLNLPNRMGASAFGNGPRVVDSSGLS